MTSPPLRPETIEKLASAVYPAFAMVAGMQLDVFTPLKDGPLSVEPLAQPSLCTRTNSDRCSMLSWRQAY